MSHQRPTESRNLPPNSPAPAGEPAARAAPSRSATADLLAWYDAARRDLPWRRTRDPYAILVAEVMLQQTQVATVVPYYRRFLDRFPSLAALAAAPLEEVLALWAGLGYYRRARGLQAAAQAIVAAGSFPGSAAELARLPGVGDYTAAAVASIAFGEAVAVLDGNVARVAARRLGHAEPIGTAAARRRLHEAATALVDRERPGDSNQALMELGATLCRPLAPACGLCPLAAGCAARAAGSAEQIPPPRRRRPTEAKRWFLAAVGDGARLLLFRRGDEEAVLAGLWELPTIEAMSARGAARRLGERYGGRFRLGRRRGRTAHGITYRQIELALYDAVWEPPAEIADGGASGWFTPREIRQLATGAATGKALALLGL